MDKADDVVRRKVARAVLLDPSNCVLLLSAKDPGLPPGAEPFWITPGGGTEGTESLEDAARREVYEETGYLIGSLDPPLWRRRATFVFESRAYEQDEWYFVVDVPRFEVRPTSLTEVELRSNTGWRWWPIDELESTSETVYPHDLAQLLASRGEQLPAHPNDPGWIS
jgi:8-oxo-dGTP pyrophosphatase MutT (NUDIX family)